jgi:hypothetical protein
VNIFTFCLSAGFYSCAEARGARAPPQRLGCDSSNADPKESAPILLAAAWAGAEPEAAKAIGGGGAAASPEVHGDNVQSPCGQVQPSEECLFKNTPCKKGPPPPPIIELCSF